MGIKALPKTKQTVWPPIAYICFRKCRIKNKINVICCLRTVVIVVHCQGHGGLFIGQDLCSWLFYSEWIVVYKHHFLEVALQCETEKSKLNTF